jgi:hypothetical protein
LPLCNGIPLRNGANQRLGWVPILPIKNGIFLSSQICHLRIGLHALVHTLCFGTIIVKAIQLRNAETLALMGVPAQQISYLNYWLMLMFIFAVQVRGKR